MPAVENCPTQAKIGLEWATRHPPFKIATTKVNIPDKISSSMKAVAIKKGQILERAPSFREMGTLRCDACGEEFVIFHEPTVTDLKAAEQQAHWLEKVLAEEHERESKHPDRIHLPD